MKANAPENMFIPEKIYLPYKDGKVIGLVKETGVPFKSGVDGNIEYVRTDTFVEKATKWIELSLKYYSEGGKLISTDKMIEDFKHYMKENKL